MSTSCLRYVDKQRSAFVPSMLVVHAMPQSVIPKLSPIPVSKLVLSRSTSSCHHDRTTASSRFSRDCESIIRIRCRDATSLFCDECTSWSSGRNFAQVKFSAGKGQVCPVYIRKISISFFLPCIIRYHSGTTSSAFFRPAESQVNACVIK